jgi:hypothetical protein
VSPNPLSCLGCLQPHPSSCLPLPLLLLSHPLPSHVPSVASYRFSVTVSKGAAGQLIPRHPRSATASVAVNVVPGSPALLTPASSSLVVNPSQLARLSVVVDARGAQNVTLAWTCPDLDQGAFAAAVQSLSRATSFLVVRATPALVPGGVYAFVLSATSSGVTSSTTVRVSVNQAPRNGYGAVRPTEGTSLSTPFEVSALGWTDDSTVRGNGFG